MISMQQVRMSFGDVELLKDISFSIASGEKVSLVGPGGSGKSTILKILLGLLKPLGGHGRSDGHQYGDQPMRPSGRRRCAKLAWLFSKGPCSTS